MKIKLIILGVLFFSLTSCKNEPPIPADTAPVSENDAEQSVPAPDPMCAEIQDMVASMPKLEKYKGYHLYETLCHPNRTFGYTYESDDKDRSSTFTIIIRDLRNPDNVDFIDHVVNGYAEAQASKVDWMRTSKLSFGTNGFVVCIADEKNPGGAYEAFFKNDYYLYFHVVNNKQYATPDALEAFVNPLLNRIDSKKLK